MGRQMVRGVMLCLLAGGAALWWGLQGATRAAEPKSTPTPASARFEFLDRGGKPVEAITDGDDVTLRVTIDHAAEMATAVAFTLGEDNHQIGACIIPMGSQACELKGPALGWYWSKGPRPESSTEWYFGKPGRPEVERDLTAAPNDAGLPPTLQFRSSMKIRVAARPVVLVHGLNSNATTWKSYTGQEGYLAAVVGVRGFAVGDKQFEGELSTGDLKEPLKTTRSIPQNAETLGRYIAAVKNATGAQKVDLVTHSMGGLIARYYIDRVMAERDVAQLLMIGTPNGGSNCAGLPAALGFYVPASLELRPTYLNEVFNQQVTKRHGVPFFTLAGIPIKEAFKAPCSGAPSDLVVGKDSATAIDSTVAEMPVLHTEMTSSEQVFKEFVLPALQRPGGAFPAATEPGAPTAPASDAAPVQFTKVFTGHVDFSGSREIIVQLDQVSVAGFALLDPSRSLKVTVRGASGNVIELDAATHGLLRVENPETMVTLGYGFQNPNPGTWKVTLDATDKTPRAGADFALSAQVVGGAVLKAQPDKLLAVADSPVTVTASLELASQPLADATFKAILRRPTGKTEELTFDPQRRIVFTPTDEGVHAIDVVAEAKAGGRVIERTALLVVSVEPNPNRGLWRIALIAIAAIAVVTFILFWLKSRREDRPAGGLGPL